MLHLTGVKAVNPTYEVISQPAVTLDDIKRFRQLDSKCPGHPEYRWTSGVETTTGPLRQGITNSVGMAIVGRWMAFMELPVIFVFTHDSIAVGEDGPTHQPVEQLASLRAISGLITLRPADANEVVEA